MCIIIPDHHGCGMATPSNQPYYEHTSLDFWSEGKRWNDASLRLLIAVLVPELPYLTSDHLCHMRLNKHVCRIKHVHDEPL